ncbi:hypothetical protein [Sorangium cellulosum]|nr:hypothetical protein [Sorangium cellulosum]
MRYPALLIASLVMSACSAYRLHEAEMPGAPPRGAGRICVLRSSASAWAATFVVRDNGRLVGATRGGTFFCYFAGVGRHHITSESDGTDEATVVVADGRRYYLEQDTSNTFGYVRADLRWVDEQTGYEMMRGSEHSALVDAPDGEVLRSGVAPAR